MRAAATVIVMDAGAPPDLEVAGSACAGSLSFEMSTGSDLLFVNAGRPTAPDAHARALARATVSHNTLCLNDQSSSTLVRNAKLEQAIGAVPIRHPDVVKCIVHPGEAGISVDASHDGYLARFNLMHTRLLHLDASGARLDGVDTLSPAKGVLRLAWDLPFAIHFHLHPEAEAEIGQTPDVAEVALDTGELWRMSVTGARPCRSRTARISPTSRARAPRSRSCCGACAAAPPRWPGGSSACARAGRWTPGQGDASARKSGKPKSMRSDVSPATSRRLYPVKYPC